MQRLPLKNLTFDQTPSHKCSNPYDHEKQASFCLACGKYISKQSNTVSWGSYSERAVYRPRKYELENVFCADGNAVINQMIKKQSNNRYFNRNANHLGYRNSLIRYIKQLIERFEFSIESFHLACAILDAIFSLYAINETQIKMLIVISVILAGKMNEALEGIPELSTISQQFSGEFSVRDLEECESMVFKVLDYNMNIITPLSFARQFIYRGIIFSDDFPSEISSLELNSLLNKIEELVLLFINISIQNYSFYEYKSITIAVSAVVCARKAIGVKNIWNEDLESLCCISFTNIKEVSKSLYEEALTVYPRLNEIGYKSKTWQEKTPESKTYPKNQSTKSSKFGTDMSNKSLNKQLHDTYKIQEFKFENDAGKENKE